MSTEEPTVPYGYCQCGCGDLAPVAKRTSTIHGMVKGQPMRFIHGHRVRLDRKTERYRPEDRGHDTPCWIWLLGRNRWGYGKATVNGRTVQAHRAVWEELRAPIPDGLQLDHLCRVRECVNPEHLEPVTGAVNSRRGIKARLTSGDVQEIRAALAAGTSQGVIAARFGIARTTVSSIAIGKSWRIDGTTRPGKAAP